MPRAFRIAAGFVLIGIAIWTMAKPSSRASIPATVIAPPTIETGPSRLTDEDRSFLKDLTTMTRTTLDDLSEDDRQQLLLKISSVSARLPNSLYKEDLVGSGEILLTGDLEGPDAFHSASGRVFIIRMKNGEVMARLDGIQLQNAPILRVALSGDSEGDPNERPVALGSLKGNLGWQNYLIPKDTALTGIHSLSIYSLPFNTRFAFASLR